MCAQCHIGIRVGFQIDALNDLNEIAITRLAKSGLCVDIVRPDKEGSIISHFRCEIISDIRPFDA